MTAAILQQLAVDTVHKADTPTERFLEWAKACEDEAHRIGRESTDRMRRRSIRILLREARWARRGARVALELKRGKRA